ncbi:MAG: TCP-1/cpn60 chaperonin family protein [Candidatus Aenigmarchaeota archaeon]|nr:TCP-1/cpn60 chaperonin family protein [Candidatus Aenigmarchaeota archaeon]
MNGQMGGQPILVLPEGTLRQLGKDAQKANIAAAKAVAETVKTTLGPRGMDKMLVDTIGDVVITNDGATILDEMEIEHPAAKMMVEVAKTQEDEVGDGTTTAVVLSGELLKTAELLLEQNIHPTVIIKGYRMAKKKVLEALNILGKDVTVNDKDILRKIALTAMTGKGSEAAKDSLGELAVKAVEAVMDNGKINTENIQIEKRQGGSIDDTELIQGVVIDKEIVHANMPKLIKNAKVALIDSALEVKETETDAQIRISKPTELKAFMEQEAEMIKDMVNKIVSSGANVVFCQKGIDDLAQHYLAKNGIAAVRRVKKSDMDKLAKATGANIITSIEELSKEDLGEAGVVEEKKIADEEMVIVKECKNPKAVSILIRGGTEHVVDEVKRAMEDAIQGVAGAIEVGKFISGGGSAEVELGKILRNYAESVGGREQLAINAFADALEVIPRTLAESAGMDPIDALVKLRTKHEKGEKNYGVDVVSAGIADMINLGVIEPLKIKTQAIKSATEAAEMILRIDDTITASKINKGGSSSMPPSGAGMGGMM